MLLTLVVVAAACAAVDAEEDCVSVSAVCSCSMISRLTMFSRWECCLASCSTMSSSLCLFSRSNDKSFCHFRPWPWLSSRNSADALIIALEVILKSVALSLTAFCLLLRSKLSLETELRLLVGTGWGWLPVPVSNSLNDLCNANPCLTMRSWHVWRSSNLEPSSFTTLISSTLSISWPMSPSRSWLRPEPKIPPVDSSSSDSILWMALALANSKAVTHRWRWT